ncbi:MAG: zinc ribbon domain-containing protein [Bacillota bacterium]
MVSNRTSRLLLLVGGGVGIALLIIAFRVSALNALFLVAGFSVLVISLLIAQFIYAWSLFKTEEADRKASMTLCPHCKNPVYKDDKVCPYCHKEL